MKKKKKKIANYVVILFFQFKEVRFHLGSFDQEIGTLSWKTLPKS